MPNKKNLKLVCRCVVYRYNTRVVPARYRHVHRHPHFIPCCMVAWDEVCTLAVLARYWHTHRHRHFIPCCTVAWDEVCTSKASGGLDLKKTAVINQVFMLKWLWLLINKADSLWVNWTSANYLKGSNFWTVKAKPGDSFVWKTILNLRGYAANFISYKIVDEFNTNLCMHHGLTPSQYPPRQDSRLHESIIRFSPQFQYL